jgi:hypothetical protein
MDRAPRKLLIPTNLLLVALLAILSGGCGSEPSEAATDLKLKNTELDPIDIVHAAEAWNLLQQEGENVWPGWGATPPPLLLRKGEFDYLIGHPAPPEGFELLPDVSIQGESVYRYRGHLIPRPAATAWSVGDVWSVALPTYEEFRQAVRELLGPDAIELDDVSFIRSVTHEAFHAYQFVRVGGMAGLPQFVQAVEEEQVLERLAQRTDLDGYHIALGEALRSGLEAETDAAARQSAARFLELRREWRAGQPEQIAIFEKSIEWLEGLARYADTSLLRLAASSAFQARSLLVEQDVIPAYPDADATWEAFMDQLSDPTQIPGGLRDRYYAIGAGEAFLLDRLMPGWQPQALPAGVALEDLLAQALTPER